VKVEPFGPLDPALYREIVRRALAEDLRWGDVTTEAIVSSDLRARGDIIVKSPCVIAGLDVTFECFRQLDPHVELERRRRDGERCAAGDRVATLVGFATALLTAERTALNFLQRMSGVATLTRQFVDASGSRITVLDTRKTTPTLRVLEKYAVRAGGGVNHRLALDDGILIKDNHVRLGGGVAAAVRKAREAGDDMPIEVEAQTLADVDAAIEAGANIVLVDNMSIEHVREAVRRSRGRAKVEISGGVTLDRVAALAATGAEYVSVGALTHSAPAVDISLELENA
jgi:nicotinate-nucleotide pyrophosphorylase (carboxylating)